MQQKMGGPQRGRASTVWRSNSGSVNVKRWDKDVGVPTTFE